MAYVPKSKYKVLYTPGGELVYYDNKKLPYVGDYIKMSNGTYYAGKDILNTNIKLVKPSPKVKKGFTYSVFQDNYNNLKPRKYNFLSNVESIQSIKPIPVLKDYKKGFIKRYFAKKNNESLGYLEIDKETYDSIKKRKGEYDHNLYTIGFIEWSLEGDITKTNKNILDVKEKKFPNVSLLFPILNEFSKEKKAKHNIKGRVYPDGEMIPTNLPPAYGLPKKANQYCQNCRFRKKKKCNFWGAEIRTGYWCKAWKMMVTDAPQFTQTRLPKYRNQTDIQTPSSPSGGGSGYSAGGGSGTPAGGSSGGGGAPSGGGGGGY